MQKLTKKIFIGISILSLVILINQNLEANTASSAHDTNVKKIIGFEPYKEGHETHPINHNDSE